MSTDVVVLNPADHRGKRGSAPRHGNRKLYEAGCRCDDCVTGSRARNVAAVARMSVWEQNNRERKRARQNAYNAANRDKVRKRSREEAKRRYWADPERARERQRAYSKTDKGRLIGRFAAHKRRGVRPDAQAREYIEIILRDPCSICGARPVEVDHIVPISLGGGGEWDNLAPLCRPCNASKNDSTLLTHLARAA